MLRIGFAAPATCAPLASTSQAAGALVRPPLCRTRAAAANGAERYGSTLERPCNRFRAALEIRSSRWTSSRTGRFHAIRPASVQDTNLRTIHASPCTVAATAPGGNNTNDNAKMLAERGAAAFAEGRLLEALDAFTESINTSPPKLEILLLNRAAVLATMERYEDALADALEAQRLVEDFVPAHVYAGDFYRALGKFEKAIEAYEKAIDIDPDNEAVLSLLSQLGIDVASDDAA